MNIKRLSKKETSTYAEKLKKNYINSLNSYITETQSYKYQPFNPYYTGTYGFDPFICETE